MPEPAPLAKAKLIELKNDWSGKDPDGLEMVVQFNPETLKVTYSNQVVPPQGKASQDGPAAFQFVGTGTTKLSLQLWFDVSGQDDETENPVIDVRNLTKNVAYFMTPKEDGKHLVIPAVRFLWGSFSFDGVMDSLDESLEYFSREGIPLRASMSFGLTQQKIEAFTGAPGTAASPGGAGPTPGTQPLTAARQGESVQSMVARGPAGADWKAVATANGIENPRFLQPGTLVNLNVSATVSVPGVRGGVGIG
jgi:hypothetical protein